jgi:hypothetical protein
MLHEIAVGSLRPHLSKSDQAPGQLHSINGSLLNVQSEYSYRHFNKDNLIDLLATRNIRLDD